MHDPVGLLVRSLDQAAAVLDGVADTDPAAPTPCRDWTLADLADHVMHDLSLFTVAAHGDRPDYSTRAPHVALPYGDAFRAGAAGLLDVWRAGGDPVRIVTLPIGERPASFVMMQQTAEFAVHAWDLARASGQTVDWNRAVAEAALDWSRGTMRPEFRGDGKPFGPEVEVPAGASPQERLVSWFGRRP